MFSLTLGRFDIELKFNARRDWREGVLVFKQRGHSGYRHIVWGCISLVIENWTAPDYAVCAQCNSPEIGEKFVGDEGWTVCADCGAVEQGYKHLTKREYEALS